MQKVSGTKRVAHMVEPLTFGANANLQALDEAIGGARVVLLGEQSHGDGAAFAAKSRIVEHLHRSRGFDVLAFEADFYALERGWSGISDPPDVTSLSRHVYRFWQGGSDISPLWDLVRERLNTERPLIVTGIDPRHSGAYEKEDVAKELEAHLVSQAIDFGPDWQRFRRLLVDLLEKEYEHRVNAGDRQHFIETSIRLRNSLRDADGNSAFWRQELRNLVWSARTAWAFEGRDEGMGQNLAWLANHRYPHKKIIVWTHNFHVARSASTLDASHPPYALEREKFPDTPLGEVAVRELGSEARSIALISGQGWYSPLAWSGVTTRRSEIKTPATGSLEDALLASDVTAGYLNLGKVPEPFTMDGLEHDIRITTEWHRVFDGVIYLRDMTGLADD